MSGGRINFGGSYSAYAQFRVASGQDRYTPIMGRDNQIGARYVSEGNPCSPNPSYTAQPSAVPSEGETAEEQKVENVVDGFFSFSSSNSNEEDSPVKQ